MAHFVHLVKQEDQLLQSEPLDPVPCPAPNCLDLSTTDYDTFEEFADWLSDRVNQSLIEYIIHYWYSDTKGFGSHRNPQPTDPAMVMNMQSAFGAALLYMGLANGTIPYIIKAIKMGELYMNPLNLSDGCFFSPLCISRDFPDYNFILQSNNSYKWYHKSLEVLYSGNKCFPCHSFTFQPKYKDFTAFHEDVGHGVMDLIFPYVANRFELASNSNIFFRDAIEMTRFKNTFAKNIWKGSSDPFNFWNSVFGSDGPISDIGGMVGSTDFATPNRSNQFTLAYMPLYKFEAFDNTSKPLYNILMDYYSNSIHPFGINSLSSLPKGRNLVYWGLSEIVAAQWDKECPNLTLKKRKVVYHQDFTAQADLIVDPAAVNGFDAQNVNSFADPKIQDPVFDIEPDITVNMKAANKIVLKPGFRAKKGCNYRAYIDPLTCGSGPQCKTANPGNTQGTDNNSMDRVLVDNEDIKADENVWNELIIDIYPNPNSGTFTLSLQSENTATVYVMDVLGDIIYQLQLNYSTIHQIDLSTHPKGVYFVKVVSGDEIIVKKVVYQ